MEWEVPRGCSGCGEVKPGASLGLERGGGRGGLGVSFSNSYHVSGVLSFLVCGFDFVAMMIILVREGGLGRGYGFCRRGACIAGAICRLQRVRTLLFCLPRG